MHKVIFYPVGNGDTSQIVLANGKRLLFDFRHQAAGEDDGEPVIDLKERLKVELDDAGKDAFDVVAFTHGDSDHIGGSTEFFELWHAKKFQGDDRVPIPELWVPAAMILEEASQSERSSEFVVWRQEARHRLREGAGIRVFSKPAKLKDWLEGEGCSLDSRRHLITDAGQVVPGLTLANDGLELFTHSPFVKHTDEGDDMRNSCALIFNIRFRVGRKEFDYFAIGDSEWEVLEDIVATTVAHGNDERLCWDLFNIPHHCSYLALSDEKGTRETVPKDKVKFLLQQAREGAHMVSSSHPIEDTAAGRARTQPPHVQAKNCYERYLADAGGGRVLVTMEEPNTTKPEPIVFVIDEGGISRESAKLSAPAILAGSSPPRAG